MKILFKIIFFISLIINVLNACSGKGKTECNSDNDCTWEESAPATCTAINNVMTSGCSEANTNAEACAAVKATGNIELCEFEPAATSTDSNTCTVITSVIEGLCTNAATNQGTCEGVLKGDTKLCTFTDATGTCNDKELETDNDPVTFTGDITITLKSVKGKAVVITIVPAAADKDKQVTAVTEIKNLQLNSGTSFTKDLTCQIAKGSKLGDVACTMDTAATKDTKYKLIAKSGESVSFDGEDDFEGTTITVDATEVAATEETSPSAPENNSSSYMKISSFFTFLFLLF